MKKTLSVIVGGLIVALIGLYASGWAPRDVEDVTGRVPGQWVVSESAKVSLEAKAATAYYFGPLDPHTKKGRLITVGQGGAQKTGAWRVVQEIPEKDRIRIEVSGLEATRVLTLTLSDDGRSMKLGGPVGLLEAFSSSLTYVDAETSPALFDFAEIQERIQMFVGD